MSILQALNATNANRFSQMMQAMRGNPQALISQPPASMMAVYEYIHEKNIEAAAEVKAMQALYKEA